MLTGYEQPKYFASLIKASDVFFFFFFFFTNNTPGYFTSTYTLIVTYSIQRP